MNEIRENLNEKIKQLYNHLLNDDIQKEIMDSIIEGKEPEEYIESLIKKMKVKK